jgi:hypothetical protein
MSKKFLNTVQHILNNSKYADTIEAIKLGGRREPLKEGVRPLSEYNEFFAQQREQGYTAKQIGKMWRRLQGEGFILPKGSKPIRRRRNEQIK